MTREQKQAIYKAKAELPEPLEVPFVPKNIWEGAKGWFGLNPSSRQIHIKPITTGARERYTIHASVLDLEDLRNDTDDIVLLHTKAVSKRTHEFIMCLCVAIQNNDKPVEDWLYKTVRLFNQQHIDACVAILSEQINVQGFLKSIILVTGMSLKPEEIIASESN